MAGLTFEQQEYLLNNTNDFGAGTTGLASLYGQEARKKLLSNVENSYTPNWNTDLNQFTASTGGADPGVMDTITSKLGDKDFMAGALGIGQLGLGLANYFQQKPLLEAQLDAYKQNTAFMKQEQDRRNKNIASFNAFRPTQTS